MVLVLSFSSFPLSLLAAVCLSITLSFPLDLVWKLNIQNHDHSRHAGGCLVQRGLAGGAASARPAAMHRTTSILHHVPGTVSSQRWWGRGLVLVAHAKHRGTWCCEKQLKTSWVHHLSGNVENRSSHKSIPKGFKRKVLEITERDL